MQSDDVWPQDDEQQDERVVPFRRRATDSFAGGARNVRSSMSSESIKVRHSGRLSLAPADILALLSREIWLMAAVFAVIFAVGLSVALSMPSTYTASASLLMQVNKDYVYNPLAGDAARGAIATIDQVVQSEVEILNSTELKKRVIARVGLKRVLPNAPKLWNPQTDAQRLASETAAIKVLQTGFGAGTAPDNNVVKLEFKHSDPMAAALILNAIVDEYQKYRLEVYPDTIGPALQRQKASFDGRLADVDRDYQAFLVQSGVGDFTAAKANYSKILDQATMDLYTAQSQMATDRARLAEVSANLTRLNPEMSLERNLDLSVPTRILALQQQRQEMLARYLPGSAPIKDIDGQIASLQAMMNSGAGVGEKDHKMGSNPVYQDLLKQRLDLEADMASLTGREAQLQAQMDQVTRKMQELTGIEARYNNLSAERDALQTNIRTFTQRIQENDAQRDMTKGADEAVRVVEKATMPDKPKSLKKIIAILAFLFAGVTALGAGLLRVFTRKGFINAAMAGKALDLPVLAQASNKAA